MSKLVRAFLVLAALICAVAISVLAASNIVQGYTANEEVTAASADESLRDEIWNAPEIVYGDADNDGLVNAKDLILLRKYLANLNPDTGESTQVLYQGADNNGDGAINSRDLIMLRKYLANINPDTGESTVVLGPSN